MQLRTKEELSAKVGSSTDSTKIKERIFSKDYIDFLNDAGCKLEKKIPSTSNNYSDLLEDTEWKSDNIDIRSSKHYRRDLDALS